MSNIKIKFRVYLDNVAENYNVVYPENVMKNGLPIKLGENVIGKVTDMDLDFKKSYIDFTGLLDDNVDINSLMLGNDSISMSYENE